MSVFAILACATLVAVPSQDVNDRQPRRLLWTLGKNKAAEYEYVDRTTGKPVPGRSFWLFGSELQENGGNRLAIHRYWDIPLALVFRIPALPVKPGDTWDHAQFFFDEAHRDEDGTAARRFLGNSALRPVQARGRYVFLKLERDRKTGDLLAVIDGEFTLYELIPQSDGRTTRLTVSRNDLGVVTTSIAFSIPGSRLVRAAYSLKGRVQERQITKNDARVLEKRANVTEVIEFREDVELDPAKMTAAIGIQAKKAADWLLRQQRTGGDWGDFSLPEDRRLTGNITGLCVRALLAAGVKPDDPAIDRAMKSLAGAPAGTPKSVEHKLSAIVYRRLPREKSFAEIDPATLKEKFKPVVPAAEAEQATLLTFHLVTRRDSRIAAWCPGQRDTVNPVTTAHALSAIAWGEQLGYSPPPNFWKATLDLLLGTGRPQGAEVELAIDGVTFPEPAAAGANRVRPASWRFDLADPDSRDRGSGFTVLAAAEGIKLCQVGLERQGALTDAQKTAISRAQREALAWVQVHRTWRTPPPTEDDWSWRRYEFAHALARVLILYGATKIDGADWHLEGAYHLMREQMADGRFDSGSLEAVPETAHAILFLTRGVARPGPVR